ncbi:MAG: sigma-70 family RNA polymerase sigma factor [Clostridia bacterium]|nr:sigma-70 family RNA polymerase sigma factor [Clostridia bacterium]
MEDSRIVELYWGRSEQAIAESQKKYGKYCYSIAFNILRDNWDAEECVNDTYLKAWQSIPPHKPEKLSAFLGKITRNLALNRYDSAKTQKRGGGSTLLAFDELQGCIPDGSETDVVEEMTMKSAINGFLRSLPEESMIVFLRRYWYFCPVKEIAADLGMSESKVKVTLLRVRERFKQYLEKEGIWL